MPGDLRFYADEHVPRAVVRALRSRGVDVQTVTEASMRSAGDRDHLEHAAREHRVILTHDADILRLAAAGARHAGIVFLRRDARVGEMVSAIVLVNDVLRAEDMANHVEFIP
jgi:predicted nuclease of predicted toxin-antitoxin system